ncbi:MAG: hypothetical protein P1U68_17975, partial [Verrucomicrobiales bacterium]|nr:hypothetical protein [Verrucomicrobiales bacterium]
AIPPLRSGRLRPPDYVSSQHMRDGFAFINRFRGGANSHPSTSFRETSSSGLRASHSMPFGFAFNNRFRGGLLSQPQSSTTASRP